VVLFGVFVEYGEEAGPRGNDTDENGAYEKSELDQFYPSKFLYIF